MCGKGGERGKKTTFFVPVLSLCFHISLSFFSTEFGDGGGGGEQQQLPPGVEQLRGQHDAGVVKSAIKQCSIYFFSRKSYSGKRWIAIFFKL